MQLISGRGSGTIHVGVDVDSPYCGVPGVDFRFSTLGTIAEPTWDNERQVIAGLRAVKARPTDLCRQCFGARLRAAYDRMRW